MSDPRDNAGVLLMLRQAKVHVARALLAIRADDRIVSEYHAKLAQRDLTVIEIELSGRGDK